MTVRSALPDILDIAARARRLLSASAPAVILDFLNGARAPSGGFRDRSGHPDVYYTVFGLSTEVVLIPTGIGQPDSLSRYLHTIRTAALNTFIGTVSLLRCHRLLELAGVAAKPDVDMVAAVRRLQTAADPHACDTASEAATLYGAFLIEQACRDAGIPWDMADAIPPLCKQLQAANGGYANHPGAHQGIATATASALVLLLRTGHRDMLAQALDFIETLRAPGGGFRATADAGPADLLSTASALYALRVVDHSRLTAAARHRDAAFIESLWSDSGGFRGHPDDAVADAEYTFYAILALGALANEDGAAHDE